MRFFYAVCFVVCSASCTSSAPSSDADCAVLPNVVALSPGRLRIRSGLRTWDFTHRLSDVRGLYERLEGLRESRTLRAACSGASDVVVATDETDPVMVSMAAAGLKRECDNPTRIVLGDSEPPVPVSGAHFCGCRANLPVVFCSSSWVSIWSDRVQIERVATMIGDSCEPGAHAMLGPGQERPTSPERVTRMYTGPSRDVDAIASLDEPHEALGSCGEAFLYFHDADRWGQVRAFVRAFHRARPDRITLLFPLVP